MNNNIISQSLCRLCSLTVLGVEEIVTGATSPGAALHCHCGRVWLQR